MPTSTTPALVARDEDALSLASTDEQVWERSSGFKLLEAAGLRLAVRGRLVALCVLGIYVLTSTNGALLYNSMFYVGAFTALSVALLMVIRTAAYRPWIAYLFVLLEIVILAQAVLSPNPFNPSPWPEPMVFRYDNFYYFLVLIAVSVFSYSPGLVLWSGIVTAAVWGAGVAAHLDMAGVQSFGAAVASRLDDTASSADTLAIYLDPNIILVAGRVKEMVVALLVSGLLATVVWRGRRTMERLLESNRDRALLRALFGRYVPREVARTIEQDRGVLHPENRETTVLFADIEAFTSKVAEMAPEEALRMLNEYFGKAAEIVSRFGGVVTQFQGDAILVTFNVPVADSAHASHGIEAGLALLELVETETFAGQHLDIRVGVSTGHAVAGSVGGGSRLHYTVHGEAVNLASRLEHLNKSIGTRILVSAETRRAADAGFQFRKHEDMDVRGMNTPIDVFEPARLS